MSKKSTKKRKVAAKAVDVGKEKYHFRLFISGILPNSARAIININLFCEKYMEGRYELEVIDIYQQPSFIVEEDIIAIPLLVKLLPLPKEQFIGDLSDLDNLIKALFNK